MFKNSDILAEPVDEEYWVSFWLDYSFAKLDDSSVFSDLCK